MRTVLLYGWLVMVATPVLAEPAHVDSVDPAPLDSLLGSARWQELGLEGRLKLLARARLGVPYVLGCLGEESGRDPDPIFRLDQADCTVLVLTDAALAHSESIAGAREKIIEIHYRDGKPSYETRYHFTTDRILHSPYFRPITREVAPDSNLVFISMTLNLKESGERLLPVDWEWSGEIAYLPAEHIDSRVLSNLPPVCGVAFVNEKNVKSGYFVSHEGIVLDGDLLHHASSLSGEVSNVKLLEYLNGGKDGPRFDGVIFYLFR